MIRFPYLHLRAANAWYQDDRSNILCLINIKIFPYFQSLVFNPINIYVNLRSTYFCDDNSGTVASSKSSKLQGKGTARFWNSWPRNRNVIRRNRYLSKGQGLCLNPRPAGVWIVTRPAGGGGGGGAKGPPWDLPNYWTDLQISNAIR